MLNTYVRNNKNALKVVTLYCESVNMSEILFFRGTNILNVRSQLIENDVVDTYLKGKQKFGILNLFVLKGEISFASTVV
jgi:hypothetical protein